MAVKEARRDEAEEINEAAAEVMAGAKRRLDDITSAQRDFFSEASRYWVNRLQNEINLASEMTAKLSAARSMPDAMGAYQEWASRRMEMMMADAKKLWGDTQKLMANGTKGLGGGT